MKKEELSEGDASAEDSDEQKNRPRRRQVECIMGDQTEEQLMKMHP